MGFADSIFGTSFDVGPVSGSGSAGADLAFGPMSSDSDTHPLYPDTGFAWGFWLGVGALVLLCFVRHNLPA